MKYATALPAIPAGIDTAIFWPAVLEGLEAKKGRVEKMIDGIQKHAGNKPVKKKAEAPVTTAPTRAKIKRKKRNLSPEARQRIAEAQRKRWEAFRKNAA